MSLKVLSRLYRRVIISIVLLGTVLGMAFAMVPTVSAQEAGQGIQISPIIIDLNGEKGGSYNLKITVTNVTAGTLALKSTVNDFTAAGENGNPKIVLDQESTPTTYSLRKWVSTVPTFTLKSRESRTLTVAVRIPSNAEAGGHYGVIQFSGVAPGQSDQAVSLTASVGVLLLARVQGVITENLALKDFYVQQDGHRKGIISNSPVDIVARLNNTGNVHLKPIGTLTVKDTFGKVVGSFPFGSTNKNVLPQSIRLYDQPLDKRWMFGRYTVDLQAGYGTTGGVLTGSMSFWVIPYKTILFGLVILAVLVLGLRRLLHHYNRRVIRKHQQPKRKH